MGFNPVTDTKSPRDGNQRVVQSFGAPWTNRANQTLRRRIMFYNPLPYVLNPLVHHSVWCTKSQLPRVNISWLEHCVFVGLKLHPWKRMDAQNDGPKGEGNSGFKYSQFWQIYEISGEYPIQMRDFPHSGNINPNHQRLHLGYVFQAGGYVEEFKQGSEEQSPDSQFWKCWNHPDLSRKSSSITTAAFQHTKSERGGNPLVFKGDWCIPRKFGENTTCTTPVKPPNHQPQLFYRVFTGNKLTSAEEWHAQHQ